MFFSLLDPGELHRVSAAFAKTRRDQTHRARVAQDRLFQYPALPLLEPGSRFGR
jgi:hypothetical protein